MKNRVDKAMDFKGKRVKKRVGTPASELESLRERHEKKGVKKKVFMLEKVSPEFPQFVTRFSLKSIFLGGPFPGI